ncbi:SAM-dependent methyltransferase [Oscillochloris sp. ZM17-4]|uniref:Eco57I restriction-modification methylase domain-containing protein n=1 Tax=Oscillochloris sp. ZM17-4 TaxID=2866714 RepID=UPI001C738DC5|nr:SAM-dependent methyltransferase [Oscillochloris sp. ZM17-4]MBX0329916.1 SAM-dependent methyltransferase [Oscillochloris sp. ZM17-4]
MPVNLKNLRAAVQDFAWDKVFRSSLKWTKPTDTVRVEVVDTQRYTLTPIADTGGMQVYLVRSADGTLPPRPTRNKIETRLRRTQVEHLLVFEDANQQVAVIQWVKRGQQGRRVREFSYRRGDSGEALIQKLQGIAFAIDDFDAQGRIEISKVTARVSKNLDVESVTKKFYDEFKRQREEFQTFLRGIPLDSDQRWYVSVMLNRLMFISFIQAKGFLNHNPDYLRERLAWSKATLGPDRYYRGFLRVLFFQGFALEPAQRGAEVNQTLGTIPYLNGGLFLPHPIEDRYGEAIDIPDSAFDTLLAFFGLWRWHLSERPGTSDREIDPDVLGYIFEKYINQKQMGAYYTRDDITGYICRNTIIPALFDKAGLSLASLDLPRTIADYLYPAMRQEEPLPTETEREQTARRARVAALRADAQAGKIATINDAVTANLDLEALIGDLIPQLDAPNVYRLYTALAGDPHAGKLPLSVLDPTAGSGAFLFAALRILKPIYEAVLDRMEELVEQKQAVSRPMVEVLVAAEAHSNRDYFITKSIVVRNLYGVDLMAEATEICKLRLFLRMVADLDEAKYIEPLPDIDFNIRAGNALVGYARPEEIGLVYSGSVVGMSPRQQKLLEEIRAVQRELTGYRNAQLQFNPSATEGRASRQAIRQRLDTVNAGLDTDLVKIGQIRREADGSFNTQPFHWFTAFYEILSEGGFDVIVGNPPYVGYSKVRKEYRVFGYRTEASGNLYSFAIERSLNVLARHGRFGVIVPIASVSTEGMETLQNLYGRYTQYHSHYAVRPGKLFVGVDMNLTITLLHQAADRPQVFSTTYYRWFSGEQSDRAFLFDKLTYTQYVKVANHANPLPKIGSTIEMAILKKMHGHSQKIKHLVSSQGSQIYYHSGGRYWRKALREKLSSHYKPVTIPERLRPVVLTLLNSQLFYWYWITNSNCMDVVSREVLELPIFDVAKADLKKFAELEQQLLAVYYSNQTTRSRRGEIISTDEVNFDVGKAKPTLDDIDRALAAHYGFTDEELDFIINYDIKYRMGRSAGDDEE